MSAEVRQALADAANTVDGIHCTPYFVQTIKAGNASVRMDRANYPDVFGGLVTWQVVVHLPKDQATAEKFMDEKVPALVAALRPEFQRNAPITATPQQLSLDQGVIAVVLIEGTRATEEY